MRKMTAAQQAEAAALLAWEGNLTIKRGDAKKEAEEAAALQAWGEQSFSLPKGSGKTLYSSKAGRRRK